MTTVADGANLFWIPVGAGPAGAVVRFSGRLFQTIAATAARRPRCDLYHAALIVQVGDSVTAIEMAPVWSHRGDRGVVAEGPVGSRVLGRSRLFRYEVRCWSGGAVPDIAEAIGPPLRVADDTSTARRLVELVPHVPTLTWGRDDLDAGDMWNSNSLISWLLARADLDTDAIGPPPGGRAPGWQAGLHAATSYPPGAAGKPAL